MRITKMSTPVALALVAALASAGTAGPRPGATELVSLAHDGGLGNMAWETASEWPALTPGGRFVAFHSIASNLVPGDTNQRADVFLRDRVEGTTVRVSVATDGTEGSHDSWAPRITPDGRFIAFESWASSLYPGDQGWADVFVHDRSSGTTERVSTPMGGGNGDESSFHPAISDDGRWVAFDSDASNLVPGDANGAPDVFLHDRSTGQTRIVSVSSQGLQGNAFSAYATISADGRYVAFNSRAANLAVPDTNNTYDVFVHDTATGQTELVSMASDGTQGNGPAYGPRVSADGRFVAFTAEATNLVPADGNGVTWDVFLHDRETGTTRRVSVSGAGEEGDGFSSLTGLSPDGRYVLFWSDASNLVPGDTNGERDVFLHDTATGQTELVSVALGPEGGDAMSWGIGSVTPGGRHVGFMSVASNLVPGDTNGGADVFVRDRGPELGLRRVDVTAVGDDVRVAGEATFSGVAIADAQDEAGDAGEGAGAGADVTGVALVSRPESGDLLLRIGLASLPRLGSPTCAVTGCLPSVAGAPGVVYAARFVAGGTPYEVRATRLDAASAGPSFTLHRCGGSCEPVADLRGGIGTADASVTVAVPFAMVGAAEGDALSEVAVETRLLDGSARTFDEVALENVVIPARRVVVHGGPEISEVVPDAEGRFAATLPGHPADLRVAVCLGERCTPDQPVG